jgi:hypothetical protein
MTVGAFEDVRGKTLEQAKEILDLAGFQWRIRSLEGIPQILTMDCRPNRVNLTVKGGKVVDWNNG